MTESGLPMAISVVIPVYNEVEALPQLYKMLTNALDQLPQSAEIVFVDDGSSDASGALLGVPLHDFGCTLKAYRREVIEDVRLYGEMHRFIPIYAAWEGARVTELPVNHQARRYGASKYGLGRISRVLLDLVILYFIDR